MKSPESSATGRLAGLIAPVVPVLLVLLLILAPAPATDAALPVFDSGNFTQNLKTALAQAEAIRQRIEMIQNQIDQIDWMLANVRDLDDPSFRGIGGLLGDLERRMELETRGLIYSLEGISERFETLYPIARASPDLRAEDLLRVETTLDTLRASLISTHRMSEDFPAAQQMVTRLKDQSLGTDGQLQAQQAQALLTGHVAEEVGKLLQQTALTTNVLAVSLAYEIASRSAAIETLRREVLAARGRARPYETYTTFSVIPDNLPRVPLGLGAAR